MGHSPPVRKEKRGQDWMSKRRFPCSPMEFRACKIPYFHVIVTDNILCDNVANVSNIYGESNKKKEINSIQGLT